MATPGALALVDRDQLVERIANGETGLALAAEYGVAKSSIYRHLADHPFYQQARTLGMEVKIDEAELDLRAADECTLPRAREVWRAVTWRAEREHPDRWGAKQQIEMRAVAVNIVQFNDAPQQGEIIDAAPVPQVIDSKG